MSTTAVPTDSTWNDLQINGTVTFAKAPNFPAGAITNTMIAASAGISASKIVRHQSVDVMLADTAAAVTALSRSAHIVRGATGTLVAFQAAVDAVTADAGRTVNVDLQKSTGAGGFATVLTGTILFNNSSVARTAVGGTFASTSLVAGDILRVVTTVAGSSGSQAAGLIATITMEETEV